HGVHQYTIGNANRVGAGTVYLGDARDANRLNFQYSNINTRGSNANSLYNGFNAGLRSSNLFNAGLALNVQYTWAHTQDVLSTTFSESNNQFNLGLLDPFNPKLDWGNADYDVRHRIVVSGIWDLPIAK